MSSAHLISQMREIDLKPVAPVASIYVFLDRDEIVYVGSTKGIDQRMALHQSAGEKRLPPKRFDRAFRLDVPVADLLAYEGALIRRFNPRHCLAAPKDGGRDAVFLARLGLSLDEAASDAFNARRRANRAKSYSKTCVRQWPHRYWPRHPKQGRLTAILWETAVRHLEGLSS